MALYGTYSFNVTWNPSGSTAYDSLPAPSGPVQCRIRRGRSDDLSAMGQGTCTLTISDPDGVYDPQNAASPLVSAGYLKAMRKLSCAVTLPGGYQKTVTNDAPVGYWRLDETSGTTATDIGSGAHDGTYTGGVTLNQAGAIAADPYGLTRPAVAFNGTSGVVTLPDVGVPAPLSVEAWVTTTASGAVRKIVSKWTYGFRLYMSAANKLVFEVSNTTPTTGSITSTASINDGAWHHVVGTYDGSFLRLYLDGASAATAVAFTGTVNYPAGEFAIGRDSAAGGQYWSGSIDEVAVYGAALSAARVLAHYQAGTSTYQYTSDPGEARSLFTGYITRIWHDGRIGVQSTTVEAVDGFEVLNLAKPEFVPLGFYTADQNIDAVLTASGVSSSADKSLQTGRAISDGLEGTGQETALALIERVIEVDRGTFFMGADGLYTYRNWSWLYGARTPVATITAAMAEAATPALDVVNVVNRQTVTMGGGTPQTAEDTASQALPPDGYGLRVGADVASDLLLSDNQANSLAQFIVAFRKNPQLPTQSLRLPGLSVPSVYVQTALELADRVALSGVAGGGDARVEAISHDITRNAHATEYTVSVQQYTAFTIGVSTIGSTTALIGY